MSRTLKKQDGDIILEDSNGRPSLIEGIEKLTQDAADALLTTFDAERQFGSQVEEVAVNNSKPGVLPVFSRGFLRQAVRDALERLLALQRLRSDQLTSYEAIKEIGIVRVYQTSKTGYVFWVDITPFAGPDKATSSFKVHLRHQFLNSARLGLPGGIQTDDTTK